MNNSVDLQFLTGTIDPNDETPRIDKLQYELVSRLISAFDSKREINRYGRHSEYENISSVRSAVLIFLPGIGEIEAMHKALIDFETNAVHKNYWHILPLHSRITSEEQSRVFQPISSLPPNFRHFRKIILSTNIAESSITVPDITYIIDFCLTKQLTTDTETNFCSLKVIRIIFTSTNLFVSHFVFAFIISWSGLPRVTVCSAEDVLVVSPRVLFTEWFSIASTTSTNN